MKISSTIILLLLNSLLIAHANSLIFVLKDTQEYCYRLNTYVVHSTKFEMKALATFEEISEDQSVQILVKLPKYSPIKKIVHQWDFAQPIRGPKTDFWRKSPIVSHNRYQNRRFWNRRETLRTPAKPERHILALFHRVRDRREARDYRFPRTKRFRCDAQGRTDLNH